MPAREPVVVDALDVLFRTICEDRDVDAFAALWANDGTITMWGSTDEEHAVGIAEVRELGTSIARSERTFRFSWDERRVWERGDVAWVNARGTVDIDGTRSPYRLTAVFVWTAAGWRWHTFNGSVPD